MAHLRARFWIEAGLAVVSALLFLATLISREWIEVVFGVDPDHGSGSLEWLVAGSVALVTVVFSIIARIEWRSTSHRLRDLHAPTAE
jgi:hypothetical protein